MGAGTLTLTAAVNTYGATTISAGTLQIGNGTTGSIGTGAVTDNGALAFNLGSATTVSNTISGTGTVSQGGTGTVTLSGTNSYSGGTSITGTSTLGVGSNTALGTGGVTMADGTTLQSAGAVSLSNGIAITGTGNVDTNGNATTLSGVVSGGTLNKAGAGTLTLTGTNTYGTTTISAGTLQIGNGTTGSLGTGAVTDNAALGFNLGSATTVSNTISGTGTVSQGGTGTVTLSGTNSYSGGTSITGISTLGVGSNTALGTGSVSMATGTTLQSATAVSLSNGIAITGTGNVDTNGNATTLSGVISGGTLAKVGAGTLTLTGTNTYGPTTIAAGTLQIGNGTTGSLGTGAVTDNAALGFNVGTAATVSNAISGTGTVTQGGTGTVTLSGNNSYSGGTSITGTSTLGVGSNTALGTGSLSMATGTTLQSAAAVSLSNGVAITGTGNVDTNGNATTLSGTVSGGTLNKMGAGTLTLTGTNTYGPTTIAAGTLQIGNGGTTGSLGTGAVTNNGALSLNLSNSTALTNAISGTGSLTNFGSGTLTVSNTNTYSGATNLNAGTTIAAANNAFGSGGTVTNANGSTLQMQSVKLTNNVVNNGTITSTGTTTITGNLTGSGTVVATIIGNNTATQINANGGSQTLAVASGANLGALTQTTSVGSGWTPSNVGQILQSSNPLIQYVVLGNPAIGVQVQSGSMTGLVSGTTSVISGVAAGFFKPASSIVSRPDTEEQAMAICGAKTCGANQIGWGPWFRTTAGNANVTLGGTANAFGTTTTSHSTGGTSYGGFQGGVDVGVYNINSSDWNVNFGAFGGMVSASGVSSTIAPTILNANSTTTTLVSLTTPFAALYGFVSKNSFTAEINVREDFINGNVSAYNPDGASSGGAAGGYFLAPGTRLGGRGLSINANVTQRFDVTEKIYVEPVASFTWAKYSFDDVYFNPALSTAGLAGRIAFDPLISVLGRVGTNIGTTFMANDRLALAPFVSGSIWREFGPPATSTSYANMALSNPVFTYSTDRVGTFGQAGAGIQFKFVDIDLLGFVRGDIRFGDSINGKEINVGIRKQF
jgi:autotransporter-associated beta strand protein